MRAPDNCSRWRQGSYAFDDLAALLCKSDQRPNVATRTVSITNAKQRFTDLLDAAQREPIVIRRKTRDVGVLVSIEEFEKLHHLKAAEFQDYCDGVGARASTRGLTAAKLKRVLKVVSADC
jgi:antitoxin Phd